jgi:hypothetical protein
MENQVGELTLEQQFKLESFKAEIKHLSLDQTRSYLIEIIRQGMVKDNLMKYWMKRH